MGKSVKRVHQCNAAKRFAWSMHIRANFWSPPWVTNLTNEIVDTHVQSWTKLKYRVHQIETRTRLDGLLPRESSSLWKKMTLSTKSSELQSEVLLRVASDVYTFLHFMVQKLK